jgi:hypothetical protein
MLARTQKFNIIPISWLVSAQHQRSPDPMTNRSIEREVS